VATNAKIPPLLTEEFRRGIELERIFVPHARQRRDKIFNASKDTSDVEKDFHKVARFVHYTSADAALNIISEKRLWMRKTSCMSDYSEVQHGLRITNSFLANEDTKKAFEDALNLCGEGLLKEAKGVFNRSFGNVVHDTFVTSMSEHSNSEDQHGRLSMWRAFVTTRAVGAGAI
jgi:hypothetical protein